MRRALCPELAHDPTLGVMLGVVRQLDGTPVPDATVVFTWNDFDVDRHTAAIINREVTVDAKTDARGVYRLCGAPVERSLFAQAQNGAEMSSGILQEIIGISGILVRDFRTAGQAVTSVETRGALLTGTVTGTRDAPLEGAQVSLAGTGRSAVTNARGEFRLADVAHGTHSIEVLALGYYPRSVRVEIDRSMPQVAVHMEGAAVVLDSLQVVASRLNRMRNPSHNEFDQRASHSVGVYARRATIDSIRPMSLYDVLRRLPGVRLIIPRSGRDYVVSSSHGVTRFGDGM